MDDRAVTVSFANPLNSGQSRYRVNRRTNNHSAKMRSWYGRGRSLRLAISYCCLTAFLFFGYDQGVFSGILQNKNWLDLYGHPVRFRPNDPALYRDRCGPTTAMYRADLPIVGRYRNRYLGLELLLGCPRRLYSHGIHR